MDRKIREKKIGVNIVVHHQDIADLKKIPQNFY